MTSRSVGGEKKKLRGLQSSSLKPLRSYRYLLFLRRTTNIKTLLRGIKKAPTSLLLTSRNFSKKFSLFTSDTATFRPLFANWTCTISTRSEISKTKTFSNISNSDGSLGNSLYNSDNFYTILKEKDAALKRLGITKMAAVKAKWTPSLKSNSTSFP